MPHKPSKQRKSARAAPQPGQLDAVDRAIAQERFRDAEQRLLALLDQFPRISAVHARYVEVLRQLERGADAAVAALDWTELCPGSERAWRTAAELFRERGRLALADEAARTVNELKPAQAIAETVLTQAQREQLQAELGGISWPEAVRLDTGSLLLDALSGEEALEVIGDEAHPAHAVLRAQAWFHLGEIDEANREIDLALKPPVRLEALAWAVRLKLLQGKHTEARSAAEALVTLTARDARQACEQMRALVFADDLARAERVFTDASQSQWLASGTLEDRAFLWHAGAMCAWRSGQVGLADERLRAAVDLYPLPPREDQFEDWQLEPKSRDGIGALQSWDVLPTSWWQVLEERLFDESARCEVLEGEEVALLAPVSNVYLRRVHAFGDVFAAELAARVLLQRVAHGDEEARAQIGAILVDPRGVYAERLALVGGLVRGGRAKLGDVVEVFDGERVVPYTVPLPAVGAPGPESAAGADERQHLLIDVAQTAIQHLERGDTAAAEAAVRAFPLPGVLPFGDILTVFGVRATTLAACGKHDEAYEICSLVRGLVSNEDERRLWIETMESVLESDHQHDEFCEHGP